MTRTRLHEAAPQPKMSTHLRKVGRFVQWDGDEMGGGDARVSRGVVRGVVPFRRQRSLKIPTAEGQRIMMWHTYKFTDKCPVEIAHAKKTGNKLAKQKAGISRSVGHCVSNSWLFSAFGTLRNLSIVVRRARLCVWSWYRPRSTSTCCGPAENSA